MKPRRKHPGFKAMMCSAQGGEFVRRIVQQIGAESTWEALEQPEDSKFIFYVEGNDGCVMLVVEKEQADGDCWVQRSAFRVITSEGVLLDAALEAHSWDPWLYAELTGDHTIANLPARRRRAVGDERSARAANERDIARMTFSPMPENALPLSGVDGTFLERVKHARDMLALERELASLIEQREDLAASMLNVWAGDGLVRIYHERGDAVANVELGRVDGSANLELEPEGVARLHTLGFDERAAVASEPIMREVGFSTPSDAVALAQLIGALFATLFRVHPLVKLQLSISRSITAAEFEASLTAED